MTAETSLLEAAPLALLGFGVAALAISKLVASVQARALQPVRIRRNVQRR